MPELPNAGLLDLARLFLPAAAVPLVASIAGYGFAALTRSGRPGSRDRWAPITTPFLGIAVLVVVLVNGWHLGVPCGRSVVPVLAGLALVSLIANRRNAQRRPTHRKPGPRLAALLAVYLGSYGILILPLLLTAGHPAMVSIGNLDPFTYCAGAREVRAHGRVPAVGTGDTDVGESIGRTFIQRASRTGTFVVLAMFSRLLGMAEHELYVLLSAAFLAGFPVLVYVVSRKIFGTPEAWALAGALLAAVNPFLMWTHAHGFQSHAIAIPLMIIYLIESVSALRAPSAGGWVRTAVLGAALMSAYPVVWPFAVAPLLLTSACASVHHRRPVELLRGIGLIGAALAAAPVEALRAIQAIRTHAVGVHAGWELALPGPAELLGLLPTTIDRPGLEASGIAVGASLITLGIAAAGWFRARDRQLSASTFVAYALLLLIIKIKTSGSALESYPMLKGLLYGHFFLIAGFFHGAAVAERWLAAQTGVIPPLLRIATPAVILLIAARNGATYGRHVIDTVSENAMVVDRNLMARMASGWLEGRPPYVAKPTSAWHRVWLAYALRGRGITFEEPVTIYGANVAPVVPFLDRPESSVVVYSRQGRDVLEPYSCPDGEHRLTRELRTCDSPGPVRLLLAEGWHPIETSGGTAGPRWRWMGSRASITINLPERRGVGLVIDAGAFKRPRRLTLRLDGRTIATIEVPPFRTTLNALPFAVARGSHELVLTADGTDVPGDGDERRLSVCVYRISAVDTGGES